MINKYTKLFFIIPILLIFYSAFFFHFIPNDAVQYSDLGYNFFHKGTYSSSYGVVPSWAQSPGWPLILGFFSLFLPIQLSGLIGTLVISITILIVFYFCSKSISNKNIALLSIIILLINPQFLFMVRSGLSEPFFTLIHIILFALILKIGFSKVTISLLKATILAFLSLILIFVRSEGILYVILVAILLFTYSLQDKNKKQNHNIFSKPIFIRSFFRTSYHSVFYLFIIIIFLLPYGLWIKQKSGEFSVFPKIKYNIRLGQLIKVLNSKKGIYNNSVPPHIIAWYALDKDTYTFYSENILNNNYYLKIKNKAFETNSRIFTLKNAVYNNLNQTLRILVRSNPFPEFFVLLIILGFIFMYYINRKLLLFIFVWLIPSFYFLISHVIDRFFYIMLPYLSYIAAFGVYHLVIKIKQIKINILTNIILFLLFFNASIYYKEIYEYLLENEDYYKVAQNLNESIPKDQKICANNFSITLFSGHKFTKMPYSSMEILKKYLKKNETEFLLLGREVFDYRPQFRAIYEEQEKNHFRKINEFHTRFQNFKLFLVL